MHELNRGARTAWWARGQALETRAGFVSAQVWPESTALLLPKVLRGKRGIR